MKHGVIYDSLRKAFNTNSGENKKTAAVWAAAKDHESRWHGAPTVTEQMLGNCFNKVPELRVHGHLDLYLSNRMLVTFLFKFVTALFSS